MKSLVIGSNSFLGHYLIDYIKNIKKEDVCGFSFSNSFSLLRDFGTGFLDINDKNSIEDVLKKVLPDKIYCLNMIDSVSYVWEHPKEAIDFQIKGIINLLESVRNINKKISIFLTGSGEEYSFKGFNNIPISESTSLEPLNVYAVSKSCQNMIAQVYAKAYGLNIVIGRLFNDVGAGQTDNFVLSSICKQVIKIKKNMQNNTIKIGNINSARDFIDVRDTVEAIYNLLEYGKSFDVYNIASGKSFTIRELIEKVKIIANIDFNIVIDKEKIRLNDIPIIQGDISKIMEQICWKPKISIDETIKWILEYWEKNL